MNFFFSQKLLILGKINLLMNNINILIKFNSIHFLYFFNFNFIKKAVLLNRKLLNSKSTSKLSDKHIFFLLKLNVSLHELRIKKNN